MGTHWKFERAARSRQEREQALCVAVSTHGSEKISGDVVVSGSAAEFVASGRSRYEWDGSRWSETCVLRAVRSM